MAVNFEVDIKRLATDISKGEGNLNYINANLKTMFDEIAQLDSMWDGEANNAFNVQFQADYAMMQEVCKNLERVLNSMRFAKEEYSKCENTVFSEVRSIKL